MGWLRCGCCPGLRVCVAVCCSVLQYVMTHTRKPGQHPHTKPLFWKSDTYARIYVYMHTRTCICIHVHVCRWTCAYLGGIGIRVRCLSFGNQKNMHTYTSICIHAHGLKWICAYAGGIRVRCVRCLFFWNQTILQICTPIRVYAYTYMCANVCVQMHVCVPGQHPRTRPLFRKWAPDIPTPWHMTYCASGTCGTAPAVWIGCGVQGIGFKVHGVGCRVTCGPARE